MKSKEEILDHLSKTVYTHNARKSIVEWMLQHHVVDYKCQIKFAKHVYNRDGVMMTKGLSFEDFLCWVHSIDVNKMEAWLDELLKETLEYLRVSEETASELNKAISEVHKRFSHSYYVDPCSHLIKIKTVIDGFQIGDVVKYMPAPDESTTEYIEAIAHGSDGETYLCLSNGEYVRPCYCVKYKAQGEERRKLIDKLNEVI